MMNTVGMPDRVAEDIVGSIRLTEDKPACKQSEDEFENLTDE